MSKYTVNISVSEDEWEWFGVLTEKQYRRLISYATDLSNEPQTEAKASNGGIES